MNEERNEEKEEKKGSDNRPDSTDETAGNERVKRRPSLFRWLRELPLHLKISATTAIISLVIHIIAVNSVPFADFFTEKIASVVRTVEATVTGWFPFSLVETLILMLPVLLPIYFYLTWRWYVKLGHSMRSFFRGTVSFLFALYTLGVFTFLTGYFNSPLDKKLGMEKAPVSAQQLYDTARTVKDELEALEADVVFDTDTDFSVMPYSLTEMSRKLHGAYTDACASYRFLHNIPALVKPVCFSKVMSYTHFTGVYTYFTGEANINVDFPDFNLPYTAAHEMAHQRGIAKEDEANFVAYLICIRSDDAYIRYSGYFNMLQYLMSALYSADKDLYAEFSRSLDRNLRGELSAYSSFFDQYRESKAATVTQKVNDTYLKIQGTEGTKSYGMVVDLAVAYYHPNEEN